MPWVRASFGGFRASMTWAWLRSVGFEGGPWEPWHRLNRGLPGPHITLPFQGSFYDFCI